MWRIGIALVAAVAQASPSITIGNDAEARRILHLSDADLELLRSRGILETTAAGLRVPDLFFRFPIRQSIAANAEARAHLKAQGLRERDQVIGETVGAVVADERGYWFGTQFYSAEGETGTGSIGMLSHAGVYSVLDIPAVRRWSTSALLVEADAIWAGLMHLGERADRSGGLLRYDRRTRRTQTFPVPAVIHAVVRAGDRVFIGTREGPYMLAGGAITRLEWK
jgi:hypothetical protein